ncbi:Zn-dependent hydrolase, partial [Klebsiella pneumoniae]|nr:Zn-dependent hydrolase [Klebsiella pneumoniae]
FTNEEGVRVQLDMMGSVVFVGEYPWAQALAAKDLDGITLDEARRNIGYKGERQPGGMAVDSYVELHIEQGPIRDKEQMDI